jgi:hypothetical protein
VPGQVPFAVIPMSTDTAIAVLSIASVLYLIAVFMIMYLSRTVEFRLIALGLITGVLAVWFSQVGGESFSVQARPGQPAEMGLAIGVGGASAVLGRVAVLLIIGGVAYLFWNRRISPAATVRPEEAIRADRI